MSKKEKKEKKSAAPAEAPEKGGKGDRPKGPVEPSRLHVRYKKEIVPALMKHFNYKNLMAVPKLEKIVINMGLGEAIANDKIIDVAAAELASIAGQRPVVTGAKKSIANFKLRQNKARGAAVKLRGEGVFEVRERRTDGGACRVRRIGGGDERGCGGQGE